MTRRDGGQSDHSALLAGLTANYGRWSNHCNLAQTTATVIARYHVSIWIRSCFGRAKTIDSVSPFKARTVPGAMAWRR